MVRLLTGSWYILDAYDRAPGPYQLILQLLQNVATAHRVAEENRQTSELAFVVAAAVWMGISISDDRF